VLRNPVSGRRCCSRYHIFGPGRGLDQRKRAVSPRFRGYDLFVLLKVVLGRQRDFKERPPGRFVYGNARSACFFIQKEGRSKSPLSARIMGDVRGRRCSCQLDQQQSFAGGGEVCMRPTILVSVSRGFKACSIVGMRDPCQRIRVAFGDPWDLGARCVGALSMNTTDQRLLSYLSF
jgi:hypothetical protein